MDWSESGGNNTPAAAYVLPLRTTGGLIGTGTISSTDTDFVAVDMNAGDILVVMTGPTADLPTTWNVPDTTMSILAPDQTTVLVTSTDDVAVGVPPGTLGSLIRFRAPSTGRHYVRVTTSTVASSSYQLLTVLVPAEACPGDADGSRAVNFADITSVLTNFGLVCP